MRKIVLMGLVALISINMVACNKSTVAKINDVKISKDEYKKTEDFLYATGTIESKDKSNQVNSDILSFIIDNEVVYQAAQEEGIKVKDFEVNEKFNNIKETIDENPAYKEKLKEAGINEEFLKKQVKKDLVVSKYKENFLKDIKISDKEIKSYYESHKDEFKIQEVRASQILISTLDDDNKQVSKEEKEKLKTKAEKLLNKVNNGEEFNKLAKKYSDDKNSGKDGGDLGFFSKEDKNIDFTKEVFKLDKGKNATLIETSYGYHIVKITDKRTVTKSLEDSKDDIKYRILNEKYSKQIDSLYKKGKITIT
ncbi:MAG: peptidylprolyl isomerase [Clostridiales bacterium]|uniref:peptidylprolyl isomerase n=1 Tax=Terrisporobacter sp. TaxID=1965305 RepID=UPI002A54CD00|nr:peptidylprolyl isomerase [Terrisporobacter sp.]MDD7756026.1 peptidylprolyl isomerase [Clostridiales bacterium]MDY4135438.1 peptidylprolyl isomerase [Terrisporobacter sp.]